MTRRERNQSRKGTKRALTSSILAIALCVVLLAGATFAWFTDTASTKISEIKSGTLKIELQYYKSEADGWVNAEGQTLSFTNVSGETDILWEPGATFVLPKLKVVNKGNLALKYKVVVSSIEGDDELANALNVTLTDGENDPQELGTLKALSEMDVANISENHLSTVDGKTETAALTLAVQMDKAAGNEYQGKSISGVTVTVFATQDTVEYDSKDNTYDANATYDETYFSSPSDNVESATVPAADEEDNKIHITTADQFIAYIESFTHAQKTTTDGEWRSVYYNASVVLDNDIDLCGYTFNRTSPNFFYGTFDGNGHTVRNFTLTRALFSEASEDNGHYTALFGAMEGSGTIKNLTIKNATIKGIESAAVLVSNMYAGTVENCHVYNSTITAKDQAGALVGYQAGGTVTGCSATDCTIVCTEIDHQDTTGANLGVIGDCDGTATNNSASNVSVTLYIADGVAKDAGGTYLISSAAGLKWWAEQSNRNSMNIRLTADINMSGVSWTPIGDSQNNYGGTFDGNGHTIKNLTINNDSTVYASASGFIGWLNGTIKNVTFENASVSGHHNVGVAVGYNQFGTVENVTVKNSSVTATCAATTTNDDPCGDKAGALVGYCNDHADVKVIGCSATNCTVTAARDAAQLIGYGYNGAATYTNLSASSVNVKAVKGSCTHGRAGVVSANALIGNGTEVGLTIE